MPTSIRFDFFDIGVRLHFPERLSETIPAFFALCEGSSREVTEEIGIVELDAGAFALVIGGIIYGTGAELGVVMHRLLVTLRQRVGAGDDGALLRASAVGWGDKTILITGSTTDAGNVAAWLVALGFSYVSQGYVRVNLPAGTISGTAGPMAIGERVLQELAPMESLRSQPSLRAKGVAYVQPDPGWASFESDARCALILDVRRGKSKPFALSSVDDADLCAGLSWHAGEGSAAERTRDILAASLVETVPTLAVTFDTLRAGEGILDPFLRYVVEESLPKAHVRSLLGMMASSSPVHVAQPGPMQAPTVVDAAFSPRMTIGMATYDDYDGVYFSVQALRMYHPEIADRTEIVVIDNNPRGPCAEDLKKLETYVSHYRYVPEADRVGTAVRDRIFAEARGEFVLCMDCHVLFPPGALAALLAYFDEQPETQDLIQGPILWDNLRETSSHWEPKWIEGMFGHWANNPAANDPFADPFEIPMQGLGAFACKRSAWPGFNPEFRGFGGEEGYIHEKFRRQGGRVLCLPAMRWMHRFNRPMGIRYPINWEDRIRNYMLGRRELGQPVDDLLDHMRAYLGAGYVDGVLSRTGLPDLDTA